MYVYIKSESNLYTVGFYDPQGNWVSESDWNSRNEAAERVHYLNGGQVKDDQEHLAEYRWAKEQHEAALDNRAPYCHYCHDYHFGYQDHTGA